MLVKKSKGDNEIHQSKQNLVVNNLVLSRLVLSRLFFHSCWIAWGTTGTVPSQEQHAELHSNLIELMQTKRSIVV
jgi:hypothetical protein